VTFIQPRDHYRLTPRRFFMILLFIFLYIPLEVFTWLGYLIDEIFYHRYRRKQVKQPVFIIGNFRSGTTYMQRILANDRKRFIGVKAWEIVFGSSIIVRKMMNLIMKIDKKIGQPIRRLIEASEKKTLHKIDFHHFRWNDFEEDDFFHLHSFSCFGFWIYSTPFEILKDLMKFDISIPKHLRARMMAFYHRLIQRHLYARGGSRQLLSKNPTFSSKIESILQLYPDAKFIYMVRNPLEVIPSQMNMLAFGWNIMANPLKPYPYRDEIIDMAEYFYRYPNEKLHSVREDQKYIVDYEQLVLKPLETVEAIYSQFNFEMTAEYKKMLEQEASTPRKYYRKKYPFKEMELNETEINLRFDPLMSEIEFSGQHKQKLPVRKTA
jgi:hypothetical protein